MRLIRGSAAIAALWMAFLASASAQETWIWLGPNNGADPASGGFNTATNWVDETTQTINDVPGLFDTAAHFAIISQTPYTVSSSQTNEIATAIVLTEAGGTADNVTYDYNGNEFNLNGGEAADQIGLGVVLSGGQGSLTVIDGTYNLFTGINVAADVATDPLSTATMTIGAGAVVTTDFIGTSGTADTIGGFTNPDQVGTLNVTGGGVWNSLQPQLGTDVGTTGVVNVSGAGSQLNAFSNISGESRAIAIGLDGTGELNITNGAQVKTQYVGVAGGFTGVTGTGSGTVNINNATLVQETVLDSAGAGSIVAIGTDGVGVVNLDNNATLDMNFIALVGGLGTAGADGELNLDHTSHVTNGQFRVAEDAGSTGAIHLANGSTLVSARDHYGFNGTGEITVTGGSTMTLVEDPVGFPTLPSGWLGLGSGSATGAGTMTVDGAGSTVTAQGTTQSDAFIVGRVGTGVLTVSHDALAQATASDIVIGRVATATGTVNVQTGGILRGQTGIRVGGQANTAGGSGTLNITGGGSIQAPDLVIYASDTVNVNTNGFGTIGTIGTVVNTANTLTVRTGGTLRGIGTINGNVANVTGGTLAPGIGAGGNQVGLLTINGSLNQGNCVAGAGGTFNMQINAAGTAGTNYDSATVSGDVLLAGTLNLIVAGAYVPNGANQFNVITGTNNIVGAFESITNRVITAGVGGRVWGDYRENNAAPNADRYYVAPRRQADFNGTGGVSGADYTIWADNFGKTWATFGEGDANGDRQVTGADYTVWADNFGQTSIGDGEAAVGTYGYGVEMVAEDIVVADDGTLPAEPFALRAERLQGLGYGGSVNAVPEPSSVVLGGLALIGLAGYALRRRSA